MNSRPPGTSYPDGPPAGPEVWDYRTPIHRRLGRRFFAGVATGVIVMVPVSWGAQHYLLLEDDSARGDRYAAQLRQSASSATSRGNLSGDCRTAAETFYGHPLQFTERSGWPPPNEKAFVVACSGVTMGGIGGGGGSD